jgi:hypothetical protein
MAGVVIGDVGETRDYSSSYGIFLTLAEGLVMGLSYSHDSRVAHILFRRRSIIGRGERWSLFVAEELPEGARGEFRLQATAYFAIRP